MTKFPIKNILKNVLGSQKYNHAYEIKENILLNLMKIKKIIVKPDFPKSNKKNIHLGCGTVNHPSFINIDGLPLPHIHYVRPIDDLPLFNDETIDLIYASHCLEHFSHRKVDTVLKEWFRVLKAGGVLRISVPDFDLLVDIYQKNNKIIDPPIQMMFMGGQNHKYNFHMAIFNQKSLTKILQEVGFSEVKRWTPNSSELTTFNDWSNKKIMINNKYYPVSLNIEAIK